MIKRKGMKKMPTSKPRVTFTLSEAQLAEITEFQFSHKIKNQTQAILALIEKGIADVEENGLKTMSESEITLLESYNQLNAEGQNKLIDYADDLVSSRKYKKHGADTVARDA